jgi:hypothetical protein
LLLFLAIVLLRCDKWWAEGGAGSDESERGTVGEWEGVSRVAVVIRHVYKGSRRTLVRVRSEGKEGERRKREKAKAKSRGRGQGVVNFDRIQTAQEQQSRRRDISRRTKS